MDNKELQQLKVAAQEKAADGANWSMDVGCMFVLAMIDTMEKQEQALIDRDLALMEQTELADRCRKQAETLEAELGQVRLINSELRNANHFQRQQITELTAPKNTVDRAVPLQAGMPATTVDTAEFREILFMHRTGESFGAANRVDYIIASIDAHTQAAVAQTIAKYEADILALYDRQREDGNTIAALRAAAPQQHAQAALSNDVMRALREARALAMNNCAAARLPESADFGAIAQNLDWALNQIAASQQPAAAPSAPAFPPRDLSKPAEQQGIFEKFTVHRNDGSDGSGGKHHGCAYFVLDLTHDHHAPPAMRAYANSCRATHPELSADIKRRFPAPPREQALCNDGSEPDWAAHTLAEAAAPAIQQEGAALDERQSLYNVALTDEEIVKALHSLAIDTFPSAYGFAEIQVSGTNVPGIRRIVARCNRIIAEKEGSGRAAPLPVQPARGEALSQQAEDSRLLDWLEANCATLTRLHDDSGYILSVNGLARSTGKTARAALSEQAPAPVWAAPVALFEGYVDGMPRIKWTAGGLPVGTELYAQVDTSFQQGRAAGIEEAAKLADEIDGPISMRRLGESIRALNKQEPTA